MLHISKRKAKWLLDNGYIKCKNSGKKTRKYTIKTKDVVRFIKDAERYPEKYPIPEGCFSSHYVAPKKNIIFTDNMKVIFRKMLEEEWDDVPDVLTVLAVLDAYDLSRLLSKLLHFFHGHTQNHRRLTKSVAPVLGWRATLHCHFQFIGDIFHIFNQTADNRVKCFRRKLVF